MPRVVDRPDHELMARTRAGDGEAFAALVDRHTHGVVGFLRRYTGGDVHRSEDLAQEVFLRVYRAAPAYRPSARFTTWLFTIAVNLARDAHKYQSRRPALAFGDVEDDAQGRGPASGTGTPDAEAERREACGAVWEAVARVPEPYRAALVLRDLQGLAYDAIAEVLGCPLGTVKSRVNRARLVFAEAYARVHGAEHEAPALAAVSG